MLSKKEVNKTKNPITSMKFSLTINEENDNNSGQSIKFINIYSFDQMNNEKFFDYFSIRYIFH